jgi:hypothetical protein
MSWEIGDLILASFDPSEAIILGEVIEITKQTIFFRPTFVVGDEADKRAWKIGRRYSIGILMADSPSVLNERKRKILIRGMFERS